MEIEIDKLYHVGKRIFNGTKIYSITALLTYECNFKCKHCYIEPNKNLNKNYLSVCQWKKLLKKLHDQGAIYLRISGGDPTICGEKFCAIYEYAWDLGFKIEIATNGYILSKYYDLLTQRPPYLVTFSLYGANDKTYKEFCGIEKGYTKVKESFDFCISDKINYRITYVLTKYNESDMEQINRMAKENQWVISCVRNIQCDTHGNDIAKDVQASNETVIRSYHIFNDIKNKLTSYSSLLWRENCKLCYAGVSNCNINPYGELYLCSACFEKKAFLVEPEEIESAWSQIKEYRKKYIERHVGCVECEYKLWCGQCAPIYDELNNAKILSRYCERQKQIYTIIRKEYIMKYKLKYKFDTSIVEGDYIVTPIDSRDTTKALILNETGYFIFSKLQDNISIVDIVDMMEAKFDIEREELFDDVNAIVDNLKEAGLLDENDE